MLRTICINFLVFGNKQVFEIFDFFLKISNLIELSSRKFVLLIIKCAVFKLCFLNFLSTLVLKNSLFYLPVFDICIQTINFIVEIVTNILFFKNLILNFIVFVCYNPLKLRFFIIKCFILVLMMVFKTLKIRKMLVLKLIMES